MIQLFCSGSYFWCSCIPQVEHWNLKALENIARSVQVCMTLKRPTEKVLLNNHAEPIKKSTVLMITNGSVLYRYTSETIHSDQLATLISLGTQIHKLMNNLIGK